VKDGREEERWGKGWDETKEVGREEKGGGKKGKMGEMEE